MNRHTNTHTETKSKYFDGHGRPSQSEESECMWAHIRTLLQDLVDSILDRNFYLSLMSVWNRHPTAGLISTHNIRHEWSFGEHNGRFDHHDNPPVFNCFHNWFITIKLKLPTFKMLDVHWLHKLVENFCPTWNQISAVPHNTNTKHHALNLVVIGSGELWFLKGKYRLCHINDVRY